MDPDVLKRYEEKVKLYCGGVDPNKLVGAKDPLPRNIHFYDIYDYCIEKDSSFTRESFKEFKSLDSYKLYESGWVQSIICQKISTVAVCLANVKHSYRVNLKALKCWIVVDKSGIILSGHCDCMAGLGEVCSHIAAVLFLLEHWARLSATLERPVSTIELRGYFCRLGLHYKIV
ncbi:hypothetical protein HA402_010326 [Bradysia odoriphaga]|nr:hypothetical protein HA402_010326 [Bradysia odoriphaga]